MSMLETPRNQAEKTLACLVLDRSTSMSNVIGDLNLGVRSFLDDIRSDPRMSAQLEVAIVTFNDSVELIQKPDLADHIHFKDIQAGGWTAMVDAVREAIRIVEDRKAFYKRQNINYKLPWIVLMSDGEENQKRDELDNLSQEIEILTKKSKFMLLPIAIDRSACADLETLAGYKKVANEVYEKVQPIVLGEKRFSEFFEWLSASMSAVTNAPTGANVSIESPEKAGWGTFSTTANM